MDVIFLPIPSFIYDISPAAVPNDAPNNPLDRREYRRVPLSNLTVAYAETYATIEKIRSADKSIQVDIISQNDYSIIVIFGQKQAVKNAASIITQSLNLLVFISNYYFHVYLPFFHYHHINLFIVSNSP